MIPVHRAANFPRARGVGWPSTAFLIHIPDGEALWIGLGASDAGPTAIRVRFEALDAIAGKRWQPQLSASPQNYVVWPAQLWIEGIYRNGRIKSRFTLDTDPWRLLELSIFAPRGRRDSRAKKVRTRARPFVLHDLNACEEERPAPGEVIPDRTGLRWRAAPEQTIRIYVTAPPAYRELTGLEPLREVSEHDRYRGERLP